MTPASINSDIVDFFFCHQRATYHGSNTNPSIHQIGINSTVLGQTAFSKKKQCKSRQEKNVAIVFEHSGTIKKEQNIQTDFITIICNFNEVQNNTVKQI